MKAITLHPWWAAAVSRGLKPTENRSWAPRGLTIGERVAIHAGSRRPSRADRDQLSQQLAALGCHSEAALTSLLGATSGAIVATSVYLGCDAEVVTPWDAPGWLHWRLGDVEPVTPVACPGQLGLWRLSDEIAAALLR